jgi:hypothetical protein
MVVYIAVAADKLTNEDMREGVMSKHWEEGGDLVSGVERRRSLKFSYMLLAIHSRLCCLYLLLFVQTIN